MQHGTGKARDTKSRLPVRFWRNNDEHTAMLTDGVQSPCKPWDEIGCSLVELNKLMEFRKTEAVEKIHSTYGGVAGLCRRLQTDPVNGLPNNAVEREKRKRHFGTNEILRPPSKKFLHLMWNALQDPTLLILVAAAALSLGLTFYHPPVRDASEEAANWIEVVAILAAVVVVVLVTAVNDWCKERQFRGFQSKMVREQRFSVIRGGVAHNVAVKELVVGDVCRVKYGDLLPADGVLIHSNDLRIDESPLTGEPDEELVAKSPDANPILFAGTHVMEGSGRYLLTAVGANSRAGIIMALLCAEEKGSSSPKSAEDDSFTPSVLSGKLSKLAALLGYFGIAIASLTILILITRFGITEYVINKRPVKATDLSHLVNYIIIGVTILMIVVPEGLPLAKTLSLAYSVKKMMKDNNLVRHLDACETMGNATTICSNKTGTLTTNIMTAVQLYANGILHKQLPPASLDARAREFLVEGICVNSSYSSNIDGPREHMAQVGNTTECALLGFVSDQGADYREIRAAHPEESFVKASFTQYEKSSFMFGENGRIELLDNEGRSRINMEIIERMASEGLRTIALCYKDFVPMGTKERENEEEFCSDINWEDEELVFSEMTTVAIVAIHDPVRPEVPAAIAKMQRAGITVRMVTGDNINTARSVATSCGILKPGEDFLALESSEFNARIRDEQGDMDQKRLDEIWPKLRVLARAHPSDKYLLVKGIIDSNLSQYREVVAVTGDCARDAPALQKADVGFAMGITGTDVAKEASDIIITDDNFTSIVKAVMWGRNVYDSIAKFLQFQLTVNVVAVTLAFIGCCALSDSPLKAVQMLWVNMVQDTLASLALATETPTNQLLKRQPYGRTRPLLSTTMVKNILGHALYQLVILLFLLFRGNTLWFLALPLAVANSRRPSAHHTIIFNAFMMMTLCNMINARKIHGERNVFHGILRNPLFCSIWTFSLLAHAFMVQFGGRWLQTRPLTPVQWAFCIVLGVGDLFWGQLIASITSPTALLKIFSFSRK